MPDHLHLFCAAARFPAAPLKNWIAFWRAEATRHWPWPEEKPIWQRDFFDRQSRSGEIYTEKWQYVRGNPVLGPDALRGRVALAGEMHPLIWHAAG